MPSQFSRRKTRVSARTAGASLCLAPDVLVIHSPYYCLLCSFASPCSSTIRPLGTLWIPQLFPNFPSSLMISFLSIYFFSSLLLVQCHVKRGGDRWHARHIRLDQRSGGGTTFGYIGETGPLAWAGLDTQNFACSINTQQSPINFTPQTMPPIADTERPEISFPNVESAKIVNDGNTLEVEMEGRGGKTSFRGKEYELQQFHFHTPSEHLLDDEYHVLEMHMVHKANDESILVMGMFFDLQKENTTALLNNVMNNADSLRETGSESETGSLDFGPVVNHFRTTDVMTYAGSLTTPPCSAGVTWLFAKTPLEVSLDNWRAMKSIIKFNARYVQNSLGEYNLISLAASELQKLPNATQECMNECKNVNTLRR